MKLSIIVPVYNEEKTIQEILRRIRDVKLSPSLSKEIIVVDDGSTDSTKRILRKTSGVIRLRHKTNKGKGTAIRTGIKKSRGEIILIQDADLEYNPADYPRLIEPILEGKAKVVYGTRLKDYPLRLFGKKRTPHVTHYLGNKFLTFITNVLYRNELSDMETCYKVFAREVVDKINLKAKRFDFEPEITAKVLKRKYRIDEVPIKVKPRGYREGKKITWKDGLVAVWALIKYRFID
jgi:glycosyltransferase involved in cell wall biosynthesis